MGLTISKWYLDLIEPDGSIWIGYWMALRFGPFRLRAAAAWDSIEDRISFLRPPAPAQESGAIAWRVPRLGIEGTWRPVPGAPSRSIQRVLLAGKAGLRWRARMPAAQGVVVDRGRVRRGIGYIEELSMTIEPWKLPIDTLRWGRVASETRSVVWISWIGAHPLSLVMVNGVEQDRPAISDHEVRWAGGSLQLTPDRTIRDAALGDGVLRRAAPIRRLIPSPLLAAHETKWIGRALAHDDEQTPVIYERVKFHGSVDGKPLEAAGAAASARAMPG